MSEKKPNIIMILLDDMGYRDLGCYGSAYYETPNIDSLAEEGIRFTDAYAACPVCSPSRASIMSGKYPAQTSWYRTRKESWSTRPIRIICPWRKKVWQSP